MSAVLAHLAVMVLAVNASIPASGVEAASDVREVVVTVGPIHIPEATLYSHHPSETRLQPQHRPLDSRPGATPMAVSDRWAPVDVRAGIEQERATLPTEPAPLPPAPASPVASCSGVEGARPITVGERVRVRTVSRKRMVGQLVGSDETTLTLKHTDEGSLRLLLFPHLSTQAGTLTLTRDSVTRLERSRRRSWRVRGAQIGGLVGFVGVAGIGTALIVRESRNTPDGNCDQCFLGVLMLGTIASVPPALVGYAVAPGERWTVEDPRTMCVEPRAAAEPKDPRKVRVGIAPAAGGGLAVRMSVAF